MNLRLNSCQKNKKGPIRSQGGWGGPLKFLLEAMEILTPITLFIINQFNIFIQKFKKNLISYYFLYSSKTFCNNFILLGSMSFISIFMSLVDSS